MAFLAMGWGLIAGSALFAGAVIAWFVRPGRQTIALMMAFGSGILLSVAAYELLFEAFEDTELAPVGVGFLVGAALYTFGLLRLNRRGALHRKRSHHAVGEKADVAAMVALATVLDGVPESLIIGLSFSHGEGLALATLIGVFLSNIPEAVASTTRMRTNGRSFAQALGLWSAVAIASGIAASLGYIAFDELSPEWVAIVQSIAGGALIVLIADTMLPEAFAETRETAGLIAAVGFLTGFALSHGLG